MSSRRRRGEGSVYQRADGRWVSEIDLGRVNGRRARKPVYGKTEAEVVKKLRAMHTRHEAGLPVVDDRRSLEDFLNEWLDNVVIPSVRPRTEESYRGIVERHLVPELGKVPIGRLRPSHVQRLLARKITDGLSARTVEYIWQVLRRALKVAVSWGLLSRNVAEFATPPRPVTKEVATFSVEQMKLLLKLSRDDRLEATFVLAITCGLRRGEILGLRWDDVELEASKPTLRVRRTVQRIGGRLTDGEPKSKKSRRTIALSSLAVEALKRQRAAQNQDRLRAGEHWSGTGFVFTTTHGERIDPRNLLRQWYKLLDRADLAHRPLHDARHGAASLMLSQGVPLKVVQETLGHSTMRLTADLYGHLMPGDAERVADAMDEALA